MKVSKKEQVFNLYNTNGRRKDTINAYKIYCELLGKVYEESNSEVWGSYPNELTQFRFYQLAIESSPEVFKTHAGYDKFNNSMQNERIANEFKKLDKENLMKSQELKALYKILDGDIEARARHYTSNLVKIGLCYENRQLSPIAKTWIKGKEIKRSEFEKIIPIDDTNLMFLRQLLKLRVYNKNGDKYYCPMIMALYILLQEPKLNIKKFITMVQMINPEFTVNPSEFIKNFLSEKSKDVKKEYINYDEDILDMPNELPLSESKFNDLFKNQKSKNSIIIYREFYDLLIKFNQDNSEENLESLLNIFIDDAKRDMINKAFGFGENIFNLDRNDCTVEKFLEINDKLDLLNNENINKKLYKIFLMSKRNDAIEEYGDVMERVMKVTGIIHFNNGIVELAYRDLWINLLKEVEIEKMIFGNSTKRECDLYEGDIKSPFFNHISIEDILTCKCENVSRAIDECRKELNLSTIEEIRQAIYSKTSNSFVEHINKKYPRDKVIEILKLFSDRKNDNSIKSMVAPNTDIPTIFEYIVGIAWYYISSEPYDVFSSLNLTMSADFEPQTHAGGGSGDIVIEYNDYILMLEVTLMNKQAQKRGEWEPVLRHATNLTIESAPKEVMTLFIADELDENTINIWRAVATVPLKSSRDNKFAESVTIMPLRNNELISFIESEVKDTVLIKEIKSSFSKLTKGFDKNWRKEILASIEK